MSGAVAVLGASGSIGREIATQLTQSGRRVVLLGRSADKLAQLSAELQQPYRVFDPGSSSSLEEALKSLEGEVGGYGGLVNCIGSVLLKAAHTTSDAEFREIVETNLFTAFATVRVGAQLLRNQGGAIVLFASAAAEVGIQNHEAIAAAKGGVIGLARSAAATYAGRNIRVNVISPGLVKSEMTRRIWDNPATAAASTELHALGRLGEPSQVAALASFLLNPAHDWITGQVIGVDGGLGHVLARRK